VKLGGRLVGYDERLSEQRLHLRRVAPIYVYTSWMFKVLGWPNHEIVLVLPGQLDNIALMDGTAMLTASQEWTSALI